MRLLFAHPGRSTYNRPCTTRDTIVVADLFGDPADLTIYNNLRRELATAGVPEEQLWQSWHGDSHVIADDKRRWKDQCPTFNMVVDRLRHYFNMDIKEGGYIIS